MIKRLPKLRGRGVNSNKSIQTKPVSVSLADLSVFKAGELVSPKTLADKGVIKTTHGLYPRVKILSNGDASIAFTIRGCEVSADAKSKIEKAGGKIS
jgi:large subunit ribosomal protein L15